MMSSVDSRGRSIGLRSCYLLGIIAALSITACSAESQTESTGVQAVEPTVTIAATPSTTTSPPPPAAVTTTAAATTAAPATTAPTTAAPAEPVALVVPAGGAPEIDGILESGEWSAAAVVAMSDGAQLHLQHEDGALYVAVEGSNVGAVNIIIATESGVRILHSSAALGSALYVPGSSTWSLEHGYSWCCRRGSADSARDELFAAEGWEANIGLIGDPGIVEYAITLPWVDAAFAVSSLRSEDDTGFFPADLTVEQQSELLGVPPPERAFSTGDWVRLRLSP